MNVEITGRHIDITPAIRDFTSDKLQKLERCIDEIMEAHVILSVQKHRHTAEIVIKARNRTLTGNDETGDMYASIGNAVDKIEKQARRLKDKWTTRRKHARSTHDVAAFPIIDEEDHNENQPAQDGPRIIRSTIGTRKPMSVEDAALELVESDLEFLVFRDSRSQRIGVLYRRTDGNLGLIEPE